MKQYINIQFFKNEFGYVAPDVDNQETNDNKIVFYIKRASSRVDTLINNGIAKGIRAGNYELTNELVSVVTAKFPDQEKLKDEQEKIEAVREQIALFTKFGIDTGYDFITGSFSASVGSESYGDTIDFEVSLQRLEQQVKEALALFDWGDTLIKTENIEVAVVEAEEVNIGLPSNKQKMTLEQYYTNHENNHRSSDGSIDIVKLGNGNVDFKISPGNANVIDDTQIQALEGVNI